MWTMLAGVPGKLKTLLDRLTAARAANLDNLNAQVSSRAPASTALSNAVWTAARAAKLDEVGITPDGRSPISGGLPAKTERISIQSPGVNDEYLILSNLHIFVPSQSRAQNGAQTVVDIQGQGVVTFFGHYLLINTTSGGTYTATLEIDGVQFTSSLPSHIPQRVHVRTLVGMCVTQYAPSFTFEEVPFHTSLKITIENISQASGIIHHVMYAYRVTG